LDRILPSSSIGQLKSVYKGLSVPTVLATVCVVLSLRGIF